MGYALIGVRIHSFIQVINFPEHNIINLIKSYKDKVKQQAKTVSIVQIDSDR